MDAATHLWSSMTTTCEKAFAKSFRDIMPRSVVTGARAAASPEQAGKPVTGF
jgi:hypothetical protein